MTVLPDQNGSARRTAPPNPLRGEFAAVLGGEPVQFYTTLGTVALIEERCGGVPIVEAINKAVFGRRAADGMALIAGALAAVGHPEAEALAARTATVEAEAFVLALMGALGFEVVRKGEASGPLAPAPAAREDPPGQAIGEAGAASRSAGFTGPKTISGAAPGAASPTPGPATPASRSGSNPTTAP